MSDAPALLEVAGLVKSFGPTRALDGVDLTVRSSSVHALLGGNGSGKSTVVKILAGVYQADAGTITLGGTTHEAAAFKPGDGHAGGLRFVHQDLGLIETASVAENVGLAQGFPRGVGGRIDWGRLRRTTAQLLERYEIDTSPRTPVAALRPALRTMIAIARALGDDEASADRLLVLDEPTASLPRRESQILLAAVRQRAAQGQGVVLISHHLHEVLDNADTISVLRDGRVAGRLDAAQADESAVVSLIAGRLVEAAAAPVVDAVVERHTTPTLQVRGLFAGALQGVGLTVHPGEIVGVTGLVGSGRSSLVRAIFGAIPVRAGTVHVDGRALRGGKPIAAMKAGVALVPEDRARDAAFLDHPVRLNVSATVTRDYWRGGFLRTRRERSDTRDVLDRFVVRSAGPEALLSTLSGGNQQKTILARWLRRNPRLLLLDEPTQGVDIVSRADLYRLIRAAAADGCAVVVASSDPEEIALLCDRAVVLAGGIVVAELDADHLDPDHQLRAAHQGRDRTIGVRS